MNDKVIHIVILNYNNAVDTIECIDSFKCISGFRCRLIIVDNDSRKEDVNKIKNHILGEDNIIFIETEKNLGYAGGNNIGIKRAIEEGAEYLAIVNNDVVVNEHSFDKSIDILDSDENVAFVGPAILHYGSDIIQYTGGVINYQKMLVNRLNSGLKYTKQDRTVDCDYVGGACLLFKSNIVSKLGYIPEEYFLFWEETDWCYKAKKMGMTCKCTLQNYINHKGSVSIRKEPGFETYYLERNRVVFFMNNANTLLNKIDALIRIFAFAILKGILRDRSYFSFIPYYIDGIIGRDKYGKIRNNK